jgi:hypothetical protein
MMPEATTPVPVSATHRLLPRALVIAGVALLVVALGAWLFFPALSIPTNRLTGWQMHGFLGQGFDPTTAKTTTVVRVAIPQWPVEFGQGDSSWLARPEVTYTPWSVTITLYTSDAFTGQKVHGWFDTGSWVDVHLKEPLRGRALFDGSTFPPAARPYP